jgi:hypothetical protein
VLSAQISHKSDVGGVVLNLESEMDVAAAAQAILARAAQHSHAIHVRQTQIEYDNIRLAGFDGAHRVTATTDMIDNKTRRPQGLTDA